MSSLRGLSRDRRVVVLGGGLAGAAAAIHLAQADRPVTLVEQHATPRHKVCGDFLSAEALLYLDRLGLDLDKLGKVSLTTLRLAVGRRLVETQLPFAAGSLTRYALDEALLQQAASHPAVSLLRGRRVESLSVHRSDQTSRLHLASGEDLLADEVVLATGKQDLRGLPRPAGQHNSLVAFKVYLRLSQAQSAALGSAIELTLFPGGYAGLQPVENDDTGARANLCFVVERRTLQQMATTWPSLRAHLERETHHLAERLSGCELLLEKPIALSSIPYGLLLDRVPFSNLWPVGDQAVVIPSLTGDGMSLALHTASLAVRHLLADKSPSNYLERLRLDLRSQMLLATLTSRLAVQPRVQPLLGVISGLYPSLLTHVARATRISGVPLAAVARL